MPGWLRAATACASRSNRSRCSVSFAAAAGSGYVKPLTISTNSDGLADWNGYVHTAGPQQIQASIAGLSPVVFTVNITASGSPYDGVYLMTFQLAPIPGPTSYTSTITVSGSNVLEVPTHVVQSSQAFWQSTGSIAYATFSGIGSRSGLMGQFTLDADGRVTGSGSIVDTTYYGGPITQTVSRTWVAERQ